MYNEESILVKLLKDENTNSRLSIDTETWLVWDNITEEWVLYNRAKYAKNTKELARSKNLSDIF